MNLVVEPGWNKTLMNELFSLPVKHQHEANVSSTLLNIDCHAQTEQEISLMLLNNPRQAVENVYGIAASKKGH